MAAHARRQENSELVRKTIDIHSIGTVVSPIASPQDQDWGDVESLVELEPEYFGGFLGLEDFTHVLVLTFLHQAHYVESRHLCRRPQGRDDMPEVGIFAQRAKDRPNPIGVTCVRLLSVDTRSIRVSGLDAIDGTPVLDVKPHYPHYDSPEGASVPEWVERLMGGYF